MKTYFKDKTIIITTLYMLYGYGKAKVTKNRIYSWM